MKKLVRITVGLNAFFVILLLTRLTSCKGQNTSKDAKLNTTETRFNHTLGENVDTIDKDLWYIFQDSKMRYWFGSNGQGLYCYDGNKLLRFTIKDGLLSNSIRGIQEDKKGTIFITSLAGINKFDGHEFTTLTPVESNSWKLDSTDLWFSILGKEGEKGPFRYDGNTLHHLHFPKHAMEDEFFKTNGTHPWSPYEVYSVYKDKKGSIWLGTANFGLCRYDGKSLRWMYEKELTETPEGGSFGIRSIIEDKEGKFWICNTNYRYTMLEADPSAKDKTLINYSRSEGIENIKSKNGNSMIYFLSALTDAKGNLWMATYDEGVWKYDGKTCTHFPVKQGDKNILLFTIYIDKKGEIWLATQNASAYKFNGTGFEKFVPGL